MLGLTVDTAKNIAIAAILVLLALSVVSAWVIKSIVTKLVVVVLMVGLALGVWTQRSNLQDCADKAKLRGTGQGDITCHFFGYDVKVPAA